MNITPKQIKSQYDRVKRDNWLPWFAEAAVKAGTTTAHFLAIGSRETNLKNIRGDFRNNRYNGFGVMQVDIGTDAEYAKNWKASDVEPSIRRGGEIYQSKVRQIERGQGKTLKVGKHSFVGRFTEHDDIRRIATAAYNCGLWAYYHFTNEAHVDSSTTGKDYSRDVYDRALVFAELLEADGERGALAHEIRLQGKYATAQEKAKVKSEPLAASLVTDPVTEETPASLETGTKEDPAKAITPQTPPLVEEAKEEKVTVQKVVQSLGSKVLAGGALVGSIGSALLGAFLGIIRNPYAFAIIIVGGTFIAVYAWNKSKDRQLQLQKQLIATAANKDQHTVVLQSPPPKTEAG